MGLYANKHKDFLKKIFRLPWDLLGKTDARNHQMKSGLPPPCSPRAARFRSQIERAEADGMARADMTLRLTHGDADLLKRDPGLAIADISFADGVMRFLGVRVEIGKVVESGLASPG